VGSLDILEVVRADEEVEVVASARLPSDVALELATRRYRHASHIRLGVTLAPRIIVNAAWLSDALMIAGRHCTRP
jgi:hypothetical protein